ncbi:ATP-binding protein [Streptomyces smyrnaeus]|uniref:ATP-binding protein n=1 Tax=Streptomyces smyrnaeus TaxID=1387713 RepID=UPI0033B8DAC0
MNTEIEAAQPATQLGPRPQEFCLQLSSTRRGARLARRLAVQQLDDWGMPYGSDASETAALLVAELASNVVRHCGNVGRDFRLRLAWEAGAGAGTLRVEVSDACADRPLPQQTRPEADGTEQPADSGYGLLLLDALADRWGVRQRDAIVKTVWAEFSVSRRRRRGCGECSAVGC